MRKLFDFEKIKQMDKSQWLIVLLVGVLLLVIAIPMDQKDEKNTETTTQTEAASDSKKEENTETTDQSDREEYRKSLEKELAQMLAGAEGVGRVQVMITLKDDGEYVVEKDRTDTSTLEEEQDKEGGSRNTSQLESQETTVYSGSESNTPFISQELKPKVEGVFILAEGADNAIVKQNISEAVLALFNVEAHKIKIVKMSVQEGAN